METVAPVDSTRKYKSYTFTNPNPDIVTKAKERFGHLKGTDFTVLDITEDLPAELCGKFDVVISTQTVEGDTIKKLLTSDGTILGAEWGTVLGSPTDLDITLIHLEKPTPFSSALASLAEKAGFNVSQSSLLNLDPASSGRGIVLAELEKPLLASLMEENQMSGIKDLLRQFSSLLWVTNGTLMDGKNPHVSMVSGLIRSLTAEQSSPLIQSIDLSFDLTKDQDQAANFVLHLERALSTGSGQKDSHLREKDGLLYISRLVPDEYLNRGFQEQFRTSEPTIDMVAIGDLPPVKLAFGKPGLTSTWYFEKDDAIEKPLTGDEVLIKVMATGLNVKVGKPLSDLDVYTLHV